MNVMLMKRLSFNQITNLDAVIESDRINRAYDPNKPEGLFREVKLVLDDAALSPAMKLEIMRGVSIDVHLEIENKKEGYSDSIATFAILHKQYDILQKLQDIGYSFVEKSDRLIVVQDKKRHFETPLYVACKHGDLNAARIIADKHFNIFRDPGKTWFEAPNGNFKYSPQILISDFLHPELELNITQRGVRFEKQDTHQQIGVLFASIKNRGAEEAIKKRDELHKKMTQPREQITGLPPNGGGTRWVTFHPRIVKVTQC